MVSFCTIAIVLFLAAGVSAAGYTIDKVEVNGLEIYPTSNLATVDAGETIKVEVWFTADVDNEVDHYVTVEAELDTGKKKVDAVSNPMVLEGNDSESAILTLKVPYEFKDDLSKLVYLTIEIDGEKYELIRSYELKVKRQIYNADIMSIEVSQTVVAGEMLLVDVVLKNIGYNDLDDTYVTISISALGLEETSYVRGIIAVEDKDYDDYAKVRFYLRIPYDAKEGIYTIEAEASNEDFNLVESEEIIVKNDFSDGNVIVTSFRKIVATGEDAEYSFMLVNPTNQLKVYQISTEPGCEVNCNLYTRAKTAVVAVPAGTSKTITVYANAAEEGEYTFNVNILSGSKLEGVVTFSLGAEGKQSSPIAVLTVILAIVFLVLLVVLIVLLGKKPQKTEEFGESYY